MVKDESLQFKVQEIDQNSEHLDTIIQLGDAHSATLGFLPRGAFRRLASKGHILGCIASGIGCVGYLLYNISRHQVKLTHLCVDEMWKGRGIARLLIKHLRERTDHLYGILASCRRDYNLDGMWASLGFVAIHERPGRSKEGTILTEWWFNYGHPNLLTTLADQKTESRISIAIDANIFYDLADEEKSDEESKESKVLIADWLEEELELCLTDEINNEINRNKVSQERKKLRQIANRFTFLPCVQEDFDKVCQAIRRFFPESMKVSDASDFRQLARVISSSIKVPFFVTRDRKLLEIEEDIYKEFNILITPPVDLILRLDEIRRETEYQPVRLAGTNIEKKLIHSGQQDLLIDLFLAYSQGEKKVDFRRTIHQFLSNPKQFECFTVGRSEEEPIALIVYDRGEECELKIPIFRFQDTQLTPTILRHSIFRCFSIAASEQRQFTRINEVYLSSQTIIAIQEDYFLRSEDGWLRANLAIAQNSADVSSYISRLSKSLGKGYDQYLPFIDILAAQNIVTKTEMMADIECMFYPAKIIDAEIPSFLIPIQAWWAKDLFDKELAQEIIWGAQELALKREVVYYRSKSASGGLKAPGRILWYVSKSRSGKNSSCILGAIRACSQLDEIVIGKPKDLYKRFRRLGIYSFQDVIKTATDDLNKDIMAVKFSDTELLKRPLELSEIQKLLGRSISVRAPYKLRTEEFGMIYNISNSTLSEQ